MNIINPYIHGGDEVAFDGFGNASRSFDGSDDYVAITDNAEIPLNGMTCSFWVKLDRQTANASGQGVISQWGSARSFAVFIFNSGPIASPAFFISGDGTNARSVNANQTLDTNTWYHIACTFDPSNSIKIYIDGVLANTVTATIPSSLHNSNLDLRIGRRDDGFNDQLGGNVSDFRLYDTDIGATAIADLYNGTNITTNLVGHWLKDTDDVLDHSPNSNNGENFGSRFSPDNPSPAITFGRASRYFDGQNDYVDFGDTDDFSFGDGSNDSPFSISAWIKPKSTSEFRIFSKYNNTTNLREYTFTTDTSGRLVLLLKDPSTNANLLRRCSSNNMSNYIGQWVHVVATYDGSSNESGMKCYINAVREDDLSSSSGSYIAMENTTESAKTGTNGLSTYADGNLADVRIYDTDLTSTDVSNLYNGTNITTNLVGHWLTDNDDVEDKAGTNDGTNFGSTYSYDAPFPANKLIDTYASTCGAYSLRELSTTWAGQSVVDVRRASDDTVQSFTEAQISDGTLATFCGTQGGFVSKIYDQSGNGFDLIQPTAGSQPRIYVGSTQLVVTDNGKPAIDFFGTTYMYNAGSFDYEGGVSWVCVLNANLVGTSGQRIWCDDIIGTQGYLNFSPTQYNLNDGAGYASFAVTGATTNQQIRSFYFNEATANYLYRMDETESSATLGGFTQGTIEISGTSANIGLMGAGNGGQNLAGLWQELVIYPNDQRHNRFNIERNVNEYYSVY